MIPRARTDAAAVCGDFIGLSVSGRYCAPFLSGVSIMWLCSLMMRGSAPGSGFHWKSFIAGSASI
jgi:hypothetical protein